MAGTDTIALQVAAVEAQLVKLTAAVASVQETLKGLTTPAQPEPVTTPADLDPETSWWPRPTPAEYLAGAGLPKVSNPSDTFAVYQLARVGRQANGELRCNWDELQAAYDFIDKLKTNESRIFAEGVEHVSSPGAQQAICLTKFNGLEVMYQEDYPVGFGAKYEWWQLSDVAKNQLGLVGGLAGQG